MAEHRHILHVVLALSLLAIIDLVPARPPRLSANAQSAPSVPERTQTPQRPSGSDRSGTLPRAARTLDQLAEVARRDGSVRIIVGLRATFQSEGLLSASAISSQRLRITQTRTALLARVPRTNLLSVKEFEFIPFVAVEVDAAGLEALRNAPEQNSIQEDALHQTSLAESVPLIGLRLPGRAATPVQDRLSRFSTLAWTRRTHSSRARWSQRPAIRRPAVKPLRCAREAYRNRPLRVRV